MINNTIAEATLELRQLHADNLAIIPPRLRVSTDIGSLLFAFAEECVYTAFYTKGDGAGFEDYVHINHPGCGIMSNLQVQGSKQDKVTAGCLNHFTMRDIVVEWLDYGLTCGKLNC